MGIDAERLKELLEYNPETGAFLRLVRTSNRISIGNVAGSQNNQGYCVISLDGRRYKAHRLAVLYMTGCWPSDEVDHINRNPSDNRWSNLRLVTSDENKLNRGAHKNNKVGVKGVSRNHKKWQAQIKHDGKRFYLGSFDTIEEADAAYRLAAQKHHGDFAAIKTLEAAKWG